MLRECLCVHVLYTHSTLDRHRVQQPWSGIVWDHPNLQHECNVQWSKEMNLCDLTWGCVPEHGPSWEKESLQGQTPAPQVFPNKTRVTAHPKSRFPEQTRLNHGPAWPGHGPSPQINQLHFPNSAQRTLCRGVPQTLDQCIYN